MPQSLLSCECLQKRSQCIFLEDEQRTLALFETPMSTVINHGGSPSTNPRQRSCCDISNASFLGEVHDGSAGLQFSMATIDIPGKQKTKQKKKQPDRQKEKQES